MIVDDEPMIRQLVRSVLINSGYYVLDAASPEQAMRIMDATPRLDLLVTDVVMPTINGREFAIRMIARRPGLRVLFISGFEFEIGEEGPGSQFLQKPFRIPDLLNRVQEMLAPVSAAC